MHVLTHLMASWAVAAETQTNRRDLALVTWVGVLPDLDGLGLAVDMATEALGLPETQLYHVYHRVYGHGLPAAILIAGMVAAFAVHKLRAVSVAMLTFHLHLFMDLVGSRGPTPAENWPISYLSPVSNDLIISWSGQWPLMSWQNNVLSVLLLGVVVVVSVHRRVSPAGLFSGRADAVVVASLRRRLDHRPG